MERNNIQSTQSTVLFFRDKSLWVDTHNSLAELSPKLTVAVNAKANLKLAFTVSEPIPANTYTGV